MVEQTNRDGIQELDEKSAEALRVYEKLHSGTSKIKISNRLDALRFDVDFGKFIEIGNLCLATADVDEQELERYKRLADLGLIEASILGPGLDFGNFSRNNEGDPKIVSHSVVAESKLPHWNTIIGEGCVVTDTIIDNFYEALGGRRVDIWNTVVDNAYLSRVHGSSGGNTITGSIVKSSISASGKQVFVTPR